MRVLLFNEYYPPDTSATAKMAALVAESLVPRHDVTVVAGRPSYDPEEHYPYALLRGEIRNGVKVERVGSTAYPRHKMRRRVANYLSYLALAVPRAIALRPDVVLAMTDPPIAGIAGAFIARAVRKPFVYNVRDLYPDMAVGGDIVRAGKWVERWEKLHRRALKQAARVIVLGDDMRDRIIAKGVLAERIAIVRDGATPSGSMPERCDPLVQELRCGFPFVAVHAGNLGFYGAWNTLLKAAELLGDKGAGLVFVGDGANRATLEIAAASLPNLRFLPFRPAAQVPHVMMAGDVHIVTIRRGLEGVVVPSKLYSILAAGRPLLVVAPKECDAARIAIEFGCGVTADPDDPEAVASAVLSLRGDGARLEEMGRHSKDAAQKFTRENELAKFSSILEEAALSGRNERAEIDPARPKTEF